MNSDNLSAILSACLFLIIGCYLLYHAFTNRRMVFAPLAERVNNFLIHISKSIGTGPAIKPQLVFGMALGLFGLAARTLHQQSLAEFLFACSATILLIAGATDVYQIAVYLIDKVWARAIGKLFSVALNIIIAGLALAIAKAATHAITGENPNHFTEFTAILTALVLPAVYGFALSLALIALGTFQLLRLMLFLTIIASSKRIELWCSETARLKITNWRNQLQQSTAPGETGSRQSVHHFHDTAHMIRPFAVLTVAIALAMFSSSLFGLWPVAKPLLTNILVNIEYREHSTCPNAKQLPMAYLDDGLISVAIREGKAYEFSKRECGVVKS